MMYASLEQAGAQHSLSPVMPGRRSGDCLSIRLQGSQTRVNSRIFGRKVSASRKLRNRIAFDARATQRSYLLAVRYRGFNAAITAICLSRNIQISISHDAKQLSIPRSIVTGTRPPPRGGELGLRYSLA